MAFYDLLKHERKELVEQMHQELLAEWSHQQLKKTSQYFASEDTYIRRSVYICGGRIYSSERTLQIFIINLLQQLLLHDNALVRQTCINTAGEIGKLYFERVQIFFDKGLLDTHHKVRNAVIGSVKKMGEVNPKPVLAWAQTYLHHPDKEIRREICHGIELRGRTHPEDILPLLQQLEHDTTARVRNTLVHVVGQIAYKQGCLAIVIEHLQHWENKKLITDCIEEIIDVHHRYRDFSYLTQKEAKEYIRLHFK